MRLAYKRVPFELKEIVDLAGGGWEIAGYASTFGGAPDEQGDVVARGAFTESIAARRTKLLYEHETPIGKQLELREDEHGLFGRWSIVDTQAGTDAYKLAKAGVLDSLSIGYVPTETARQDDGTRILLKVDLYEVSAVAIPANQNAVITTVKTGRRAARRRKQYGWDDDGFTAFAAGSYEALAEDLEEAFEAVAIGAGQLGYVEVVATFADRFVAVVTIVGPDGYPNPIAAEDPVYWQVPYSLADDGSITLGTPTKVEPEATFVPADDGKRAAVPTITSLRLDQLARRLERRGILEHAS